MKHKGRFGQFGGFYVPEILIPALEEIEQAFDRFVSDKKFIAELDSLYKNYAGRPSPLYYASRFSEPSGVGRRCQGITKLTARHTAT